MKNIDWKKVITEILIIHVALVTFFYVAKPAIDKQMAKKVEA